MKREMARLLPLAFAAALIMSVPAQAEYGLTTARWIQGTEPDGGYAEFETVDIGDVNGDGRDDLVAITAAHRVHVFLQKADGSLADAVIESMVPQPCTPQDPPCPGSNYRWTTPVTLGDMDGDGAEDIVFPHGGGLAILSLPSLQDPVKTTRRYDNLDGVYQVPILTTLDVDGDGHLDIAGFSYNTNNSRSYMMVFHGDGEGGIQPPVFGSVLPGMVTGLVASDVNGDGMKDLVASRTLYGGPPQGYVTILYRAAGGGGFEPAQHFGPDADTAGSVAVSDIDGDSRPDLVHGLTAYRQLTPGVFTQSGGISALNSENILGADLDDDGDDDIASVGWYSNAVHYQLQANGVLAAAATAPVPMGYAYFHRGAIASGDLNGDHCKDIAVAAGYQGLAWLLATGCERADLSVTLALEQDAAVVRVNNLGSVDASMTMLTLGAAVSPGSLATTHVPAGCIALPLRESIRIRCNLLTLPTGQSRTLTFGLAPSVPRSGGVLAVSAQVSTPTPEIGLGNNTASRQRKLSGLSVVSGK